MNWVTWAGVGVDRMACAWLIRRYIDPHAEFLFIPEGSDEIPPDSEPFDIPGAHLSHHGGHCTFRSLLAAYDLPNRVLARIARIVDEADTIQDAELEPAAPGLDLICRGLRQISKDDAEAIDRGNLVYDALYAQLEEEEAAS